MRILSTIGDRKCDSVISELINTLINDKVGEMQRHISIFLAPTDFPLRVECKPSQLAAKLQCHPKSRVDQVVPDVMKNYIFNFISQRNASPNVAMHMIDGAIVVVDCVEGVTVETEVLLRQALLERVKPVLYCSNMMEPLQLRVPPENVYKNLKRIIDTVNSLVRNGADRDFCNAFDDDFTRQDRCDT